MALKTNNSGDEEILSEINVTPLIDIMLVLLIIFMVTSSLSLESGLDIDLPETVSKTTPKDASAVLVSLDEKGRILVQGVAVTMESLKDSISAAIKDAGSSLVVFEGDKNSTLESTIRIMDLAKAAGAEKFAIATEQAP